MVFMFYYIHVTAFAESFLSWYVSIPTIFNFEFPGVLLTLLSEWLAFSLKSPREFILRHMLPDYELDQLVEDINEVERVADAEHQEK